MANACVKRFAASLLTVGLLAWTGGSVFADVDQSRARKGKPRGTGFEPAVRMEVQSTANNVRMFFLSTGVLCNELVTGAGTGFFPFSSANEYCFGSGLWVGGIVDGLITGGPDTLLAMAYDTSVGTGEYQPGTAAQDALEAAARLFDSTDPTDVEEWPAEFRDPATGEPIIFGQQDIVGSFNDLDANLGLTPSAPSNTFHSMGLQVDQRVIAFGLPTTAQIFFLINSFVNVSEFLDDGPFDVRNVQVGFTMDCDIGPDFGDDRVGFVAEFTPGEPLSNAAFCWDNDFEEGAPFAGTPGFIAYSFLRSPPDPADPTQFLGITNFTQFFNPSQNPGGAPEDPQTDGDAYKFMASVAQGGVSFTSTLGGDARFTVASGPFDLPVGSSQQVVFAMLWANARGKGPGDALAVAGTPPQPDPTDPALGELAQVQATALTVFNANFLLPAPPPKPDLTLIPGSNQVTLIWEDVRDAPDPFFAIASQEFLEGEPNPLFNPDYAQFDFQGYLVLRSFTGDPETNLTTVAQFDLADGVTTVFQPSDSIFVNELDRFVITAIDTFNLGSDTGLSFSFVDRDPRVRNGFPVLYTVRAFDFNGTFFTQPAEREFPGATFASNASAPVSLISGLFPFERTVPRSNSSAFRAASSTPPALQSIATGTILDPSPSTPLNDDLTFAGPIPAANWFAGSVEIVSGQDFLVPEGSVTVQVDSTRFRPALFGRLPYCQDFFGTAEGDFPTCDAFDETDPRGLEPFGFPNTAYQTFVSVRADGEVLNTLTGDPALLTMQGIGFMSFSSLATDEASVELGSPETGPVARVVASVRLGRRIVQCGRQQTCELTNASQTGLPDGVLGFLESQALYGGNSAGDVRIAWTSAENATFTDLSNDTPIRFSERMRATWGFLPAVTFLLDDAIEVGTTFGTAGDRGFYLDPLIPLAAGCGICASFANVRHVEDIYAEIPPADAGTEHNVFQRTADILQLDDGTFQTRIYIRGDFLDVHMSRAPQAGDVWVFKQGFADNHRPNVAGVGIQTTVTQGTNNLVDADLSQIRAVPNPYIVTSLFESGADFQRMEFVNLPPEATLRIYTLSGNLVQVLEHTPDEGGTEVWDMRTRFGLRLASGYYYLHATTPDGRTHAQLFAVISP